MMNQPQNENLNNLLRQESTNSSKSSSSHQSPLMSPERRFIKSDLKKLDSLLGTLSVEDGMISYVANDFEDKLRSSFLNQSSTSIGSKQEFLQDLSRSKNDFFQPDLMLLEDIETEAELIAKSLNIMMKNINEFVRHVSKLTLDSVVAYNDYVNTACESVDANIKKMYQVMAKCEELSIQMQPIKKLKTDIEKVNKLLDLLDKELDAKIT